MPEIFQILHEDGSYERELEPQLTAEDYQKLYRFMVLARAVDTKAMSLQRQGRISSYVPCSGEEAAYIGSAYALSPKDWVLPHYRGHAVALARGMSLRTFFSQLYGTANDLSKGRQQPMSLGDRSINYVSIEAPVGSQCPVAVGVSLAAKLRGDRIASLAYLGDGGSSSSDFHVAMNFAGVFQTPTIIFCSNNQYAISLPFSMQTKCQDIASKGEAYGVPGVRVDGNDVLAVYHVTKEALTKAYNGDGPTLIEAVTYRIGPHSTADDPSRYRSQEEVDQWKRKDPIARFRAHLQNRAMLSEDYERRLMQEVESQISDAVQYAEGSPKPELRTIFEEVYFEMPSNLSEQMKNLLEESAGRGSVGDE